MTLRDIEQRIEKMKGLLSDDEAAHSLEDSLRRAVLDAIAKGTCENPQACAAAALQTEKLKFQRWCA